MEHIFHVTRADDWRAVQGRGTYRISTRDLTTVSPTDEIDRAVESMRQQAVGRLPVVRTASRSAW